MCALILQLFFFLLKLNACTRLITGIVNNCKQAPGIESANNAVREIAIVYYHSHGKVLMDYNLQSTTLLLNIQKPRSYSFI